MSYFSMCAAQQVMFISEGRALHSMAHNPCPLAVPMWRPPGPCCSSFLSYALEFSSLGNQTHIYTVTKCNEYNNNYSLNCTELYIFILLLEKVLCNVLFYCTYIYSNPYLLGFYHYAKKQYKMRMSTSLKFYSKLSLSKQKYFHSW